MERNRLVSEVRTGYKIVRVRTTVCDGITTKRLSSCFITSEYKVVYEAGSWVKPQVNCGPLSVFESIETAKKFMVDHFGQRDKLQLWKCEYVRSYSTKMWTPFRRFYSAILPKGTKLADKVKLIEEINTCYG